MLGELAGSWSGRNYGFFIEPVRVRHNQVIPVGLSVEPPAVRVISLHTRVEINHTLVEDIACRFEIFNLVL